MRMTDVSKFDKIRRGKCTFFNDTLLKKVLTFNFSPDSKLYVANPSLLGDKNTIKLFNWWIIAMIRGIQNHSGVATLVTQHIHAITFLFMRYRVRYEGLALFPPWALLDAVTLFTGRVGLVTHVSQKSLLVSS